MKYITSEFRDVYLPSQALVIYKHASQAGGNHNQFYVESYDMDSAGCPINGHPLSNDEAIELGKSLYTAHESRLGFLKPKGLIPKNVLYLDPTPEHGYVIWHTKAQQQQLYFASKLELPDGEAWVPALVWKATKRSLTVFALPTNRKPKLSTVLFQAPFFNTGGLGGVCMGSVEINISDSASLEDFITSWQSYYWNSYFSHTMGHHSPTRSNIIQLWRSLIDTNIPFPAEQLKPHNKHY